MSNRNWLKRRLDCFSEIGLSCRKQRKLARRGRSLRVESLEKRELLANFNIAGGAVFHGGFEDPSNFVYEARNGINPASVYIQSNNTPQPLLKPFHESGLPDGAVARAGSKVLKAHVERPTSTGSPHFFRQELQAQLGGSQVAGQDYWYGFSIYVPNDYQIDGNYESFLQFRTTGAASNSDQPTLSLGVRFGQPNIIKFAGAVSNGGNISGTNWDISTFKGKWTDFVIHAKWSSGSNGLLEIFKNEDAPVVLHGDNIIANRIPVMRVGAYKASWKTQTFFGQGYNNTTPAATERTLFYDEQRVVKGASGQNGIGAAGYNAVKPPGPRPGNGGGPGNQAPTAFNDSVITPVNTQVTTINVLTNDTDPDQGDTLSVQSFTQPNNGSVVNSGNGTFTYTPALNFNGIDSFDYTVSDGNGGTDIGTVSVTVGEVSVNTLLRYDFTNGSGSTVVDQSGHGNTGTLTGFTSTAAGAGVFDSSEGWVSGGGINFLDDNVRSFVETTLPLNTLNGKDATIEFTSTYAGADNWAPAIGSNPSSFSTANAFFMGIHNSQANINIRNPGNGSGTSIGSNPWASTNATEHHVVMTIEASSNLVEVFVDGVSVGTSTLAGTNFGSSSKFRIGNTGWNNTEQWDGVITGVAISEGILAPGSFILEEKNGDFDSDGDVDGADFLSWQRGFGTTHTTSDLNDWQSNFGSSSTTAAATAPSPAPAPALVASAVLSPAKEVASPTFLTTSMFLPVTASSASEGMLDEVITEKVEPTASIRHHDLPVEQESSTSPPLRRELAEQKVGAFAYALDTLMEQEIDFVGNV